MFAAMTQFARRAALATACAVPLVALAQPGGGAVSPIDPKVRDATTKIPRVACQFVGPAEFQSTVRILNAGKVAIAAGRKVQWTAPGYSAPVPTGTVTLQQALQPGGYVDFAIGNAVENRPDCKATFL